VWSGWDVLRILIVAVLAIMLFSLVAISVAAGLHRGAKIPPADMSKNALIIIPAQTAAYLAVLLFMYSLITRRYGRRFLDALQWNWPGGSWTGFAAAGIALALAGQAASNLLPVPKSLPIEMLFRNATSAWLMAAFGVLLAPLVEELFFRGFLYPVLARRTGAMAAIIVTALAFAFIHESQLARAWAPLLILFMVGVVLTYTRARTGSLAASVVLHIAYNATLFTMVFITTGGFRHLEKLVE
jgi:uncharacterized protein